MQCGIKNLWGTVNPAKLNLIETHNVTYALKKEVLNKHQGFLYQIPYYRRMPSRSELF